MIFAKCVSALLWAVASVGMLEFMNAPTATAHGAAGLTVHEAPLYAAPASHALNVAPAAHNFPLAPAGHVYLGGSQTSSGIGISVDQSR